MSPTNNPEFLQQILGLTPQEPQQQPQVLPEPIPFAEEDQISAINQQLDELDPSRRVANLDIFGRNVRSGKNGERTKGDKFNTGLSYLAEFLGAFTGGPKYQNPQQRAQVEATNEYKLKAPRLIDELKILNQNKRAFEEQQSRTKIQQAKDKAMLEAAKIKADVDTLTANNRRMSERERIDIQKRLADLRAQGVYLPPEWQIAMHQVGKNLEQIASDPEAANKVAEQQRQNKALGLFDKALIQRSSNQQEIKQAPNMRTVLNPYDGTPTAAPGFTSMRVTKPLSQEEQSRLNALLGPLSSMRSAAATQASPQPQPSATPSAGSTQTSPIPGLSNTPPQSTNQPPTAKPEKVPATALENKSLGQRVLESEPERQTGAAPPIRNNIQPQNVALKDDIPAEYDATWSVGPRHISAMRTSFKPVSTIQNKIFGIENINGAIKTPWGGTIDEKTFARRDGKELKKRFMEEQRAVADTNGVVLLGLEQYIRTGGDLLTGLQKSLGPEVDQYADKSITGKLASIFGRSVAGRKIDDRDRALAFLTTQTYFDAVYAKTGMQANKFEFENAKKYRLHTGLGSDAFMFRALVLALAANRKMDKTYKELATKKIETNPENDLQWAVSRASQLMDYLKQVKTKSAEDRAKILQNTNLVKLLSPHAKTR